MASRKPAGRWWGGKIPIRMQLYALTSSQLPNETLDLFLTGEAAEAELREILVDEPDWKDVLRVVPIELDATASTEPCRPGAKAPIGKGCVRAEPG
jgi:hypothetical protein